MDTKILILSTFLSHSSSRAEHFQSYEDWFGTTRIVVRCHISNGLAPLEYLPGHTSITTAGLGIDADA
jgi:hypothetical protein